MRPRCVIKKKCVTDFPRKAASAKNCDIRTTFGKWFSCDYVGSDIQDNSERFHKSGNVQQKRETVI